MSSTHAEEIEQGKRFAFGANWASFLERLDEARIQVAQESLARMLGVSSLEGLRFLDAGSGSGLSSLAARRLGAEVHSFDFDPKSVACTREIRRRYYSEDPLWMIEEGSVLDEAYLAGLGEFDIVYSWGVLHHTGAMWRAIDNVSALTKPGGVLFIAIYNNMGGRSRAWKAIKRVYCALPSFLRIPFALLVTTPIQIWSLTIHAVQGKAMKYFEDIAQYRKRRGMSWWHDQLDWIGGYPYEDAKPEEIFERLHSRGFSLTKLRTFGGGVGCNEFVFRKARDA